MLTSTAVMATEISDNNTLACKCGAGPFEDRAAWVAHVRQGMPPVIRRKRPDFRKAEREQAATIDYLTSHGIVNAVPEILPEENQERS